MSLLLLVAACHKPDEELIVTRPPTEGTVEETPSETVEDEPPVRADSGVFENKRFKDLPYRILYPRNFDETRAYPLLVFLHGIGERGTDNERQLHIGGSYFLRDSVREQYPAFIVYPQCPTTAYWFDSEITSRLKELIDTLREQFLIDKNRISVGGFSMGAYGTFEIVSRYPGFFDAAIAIAGDGDESKVQLMTQTRWRIFAGQRDDVVSSSKTKIIAEALETAGASVSFILYPQADHGSTWLRAFSEPDFLTWLFREEIATSQQH